MLLLTLLTLATTATAAVIQRAALFTGSTSNTSTPSTTLIAQPGAANALPKAIPSVSVATSLPETADTPSWTLINAATIPSPAVTSSEARIAAAACTPVSACIDAMTCGVRYGGCYDTNYCDGNTSPVAIPTC